MSDITIGQMTELDRALQGSDVFALESGGVSYKISAQALKKSIGGATLTAKTITANGDYDPADDGADGYSGVTVNVSGGVTPTGTISIDSNGTYDVTQYASANVNVPGGILTGTTPPAADIGNDGDYYVQTFPVADNVNFIDYLESNGTQYINTGIIGDQNIKIVADYMLFSHSQFIFGARYTPESYAVTAYIPSTDTSILAYLYGISVSSLTGPYHSTSYNTRHEIEIGYGVYKYDNDLVAIAPTTVFRTSSPIALFGCNTNGSVRATTVRIYRLTIYSQNDPIADYIPCLDGNGVACMWDNVAGEYVHNDGTGNFAYGSAATPDALDAVLYVKRNGTWEVVRQ